MTELNRNLEEHMTAHICATCAHSRSADGSRYTNEDRAYCDRKPGLGGTFLPCEGERFAPPENTEACGASGQFWMARNG